jgi:diguanylate cyclase (GGDEF)-like protein
MSIGGRSGRSPRPGRPARAGPGSAAARVAGLCAGAAALGLLAAGGDGMWLCVPLSLLACACARTPGGGAAAAAAVLVAALGAGVARGGTGGSADPPMVALVAAASAAVLIVARARLMRERDALRGFALTDPLTQVANRRSLLVRADYEIARHRRAKRSFALVMLDLDGFKGLNDRFGHAAGDDLLREVALSLQRAMRAQDTVARLGGDEFCILAPETGVDGTDRLAGRIARAIGAVTVGLESVQASLGVSLFPVDGAQPAQLLEAADQRLLAAKRRRGAERRDAGRRAA